MAAVTPVKNAIKGLPGKGAALFDYGFNVLGRKMGGESWGSSLVKAVPDSILYAIAPGIMTAASLAPLVPALAQGYITANTALKQKYNMNHKAGTNFSYKDTQAALTMRQASVQAIQGSKMNARNSLGGEAALMHRRWEDRM